MAARLTALLPRLLALTVIWLLGAATFTLAAEKKTDSADRSPGGAAPRPVVLEVPDVRSKAYVFAKGILQDGGFAWRVKGDIEGYAANVVVSQSPAAGARVIDNGAPTVRLRLVKNSAYGQRGLPENASPYPGTRLIFLDDWRRQHAQTSTTSTTASTTESAPTTTTTPAPQKPKQARKPDFVVSGAPAEPADEMPLPKRARLLARRVQSASRPSQHLVGFWLYQHAWIVTGARFGWHDGAEALRLLIKVDQSLERRWNFGARSESVARAALAYVRAKAG